jgi:hypothetical protein
MQSAAAIIISTQGNELSCGSTTSKFTQRVMNGRGESTPRPSECENQSMPFMKSATRAMEESAANAILPRDGEATAREPNSKWPSSSVPRSGKAPM